MAKLLTGSPKLHAHVMVIFLACSGSYIHSNTSPLKDGLFSVR